MKEEASFEIEPGRRLDESLLRSLYALLVEASVSRGAARLGIQQPALSRHLKALRQLTGDELLVRVGNRMVLTQRGESLVAPTRRILADLSLFTREDFEFSPDTARNNFRIAAGDFLPRRFYEEMIRRVRTAAPDSVIDLRSLGHRFDHYKQLGEGEIDVAITIWPDPPAHLRSVRLFADEFVCVVSKDHPLAKTGLTLEAYCRAPHLSSLEQLPGQGTVLDALIAGIGVSVHTAMRTQYLGLVPPILANSDLIFSTGRRFAQQIAADHPLVVLPFPAPIKPIQYVLTWHERTHKNRALRWFRGEITAAAKAITDR
ncbi:LysR family transcriptional regulator [Variovorax paradoxus]|uniref:LysR family transcriptional regulator n=1 Tax=Variovorax paradoxus TaxID=34073 RepID=UPI0027866538|nr:LysR family transcriptional regulator [Variovorax paradoxus]MDQ0587994.1 DNA-binding transcriptional LysR family regulator [Variovorax paradoxus]